MSLIRSTLHMLWMGITVIPYTLAVLLTRWLGGGPRRVYAVARAWLKLSVDSDGEIMGVRHRELAVEGVQFHPESILTERGHDLLKNFLQGA